jgi:SAM-dependent methyltransferase
MKRQLERFLETLILKVTKLLNTFIELIQKTESTKRIFIKARTSRLISASRIVEYAWVLSHLGDVCKILDVGSTTSRFPLELASIGYDVYSIDPRSYVQWHGGLIHPNMKFIKGDICEAPFTSEFFDVVTAISTIEHIGTEDFYKNPLVDETKDLKAVQEIARILKKDGRFIFTVPYRHKIRNGPFTRLYDEKTIRIRLLKRLFAIEKEDYFRLQNSFWRHVSVEEMRGLAKKEGLACIVARKTKK